MRNIDDLGKFADSKYLAAVITRAVLQSGSEVREKAELFDNPRVFREWVNILRSGDSNDDVAQRIGDSLLKSGIGLEDVERIVPVLHRILKEQAGIVSEVRQKVEGLTIPKMKLSTGPDDLAAMDNPLEPLQGDDKIRSIADDISWRIWNELIDETIKAGKLDAGVHALKPEDFSLGLYDSGSEPFGPDEETREYPDEELAVLWLPKELVDHLKIPADVQGLPMYIRKELNSMKGGPMHARLWVPQQIDFEALKCSDDDPRLVNEYMDDFGGIVFLRSNLGDVKKFVQRNRVSFLTDVSLDEI